MKRLRFRLNSELHLSRHWRTGVDFSMVEFPEGSGQKWMRIELTTGEIMLTSPNNIDVFIDRASEKDERD